MARVLLNGQAYFLFVKTVIIFYKTRSPKQPILAKTHAKKHAFRPVFIPLHIIFMFVLRQKSAFCTI